MRNGSNPDAAPRLVLIDRDTERMIRFADQLAPHIPWTQSPRLFASLDSFVSEAEGLNAACVVLDAASLTDSEADIETAVARLVKSAHKALVVVMGRGMPLSYTLQALQAGAHDVVAQDMPPMDMGHRLAGLAHRHSRGGLFGSSGTAQPLQSREQKWIASSPAAKRVLADLKGIAPSSAPVFISGPQGVGKSYAAQLVHEHSPRRDGPMKVLFVRQETGTPPELTPEVFEQAAGGTLVLEGVEWLDAIGQSQLLQFLRAGQDFDTKTSHARGPNARLIATSAKDGAELLATGALREDLFYRLSVLPISIGPLSARAEDIAPLARHFLALETRSQDKAFVRFSAQAERLLRETEWHGNAAQLRRTVKDAVAGNSGEVISEAMVRRALQAGRAGAGNASHRSELAQNSRAQITPMWMEEQRIIEQALALCGGNIAQAAAALEISPSTIYRKKQFWAQHDTNSNAA